MLRNNADARRCSYFELGLPVVKLSHFTRKLACVAGAKRGGRGGTSEFMLISADFIQQLVLNTV